MCVPESWQIILDRKQELLSKLEAAKRMEDMLKLQLNKNYKHQSSVKSSIVDMDDSLTMLGWIPDRELTE